MKAPHQTRLAEKKVLTVDEFCSEYGVGRTRAYQLMNRGAVTLVKIGASTRILRGSAEQWLAGLPRDLKSPPCKKGGKHA